MKFLITIFCLMLCSPLNLYAEKRVKFPVSAVTDEKKIEFLYIAQEKYRVLHNETGAKFRSGQITRGEWQSFLNDRYYPETQVLFSEIGATRERLSKSNAYQVTVDEILEDI